MNRILTAALLLAVSASVAGAAGAGSAKTNFLAVQLTSSSADLAADVPGFNGSTFVQSGFAAAYNHPEWGGKLEYWSQMGPEYAFNVSGGIGTFSEEDKPGTQAPSGSGSFKYTQSSWNIRIGGDRMLSVGEKSYLFFGPGIEYWSGKAKFEDKSPGGLTYESKNTTRISVGARLGGHMMVSPAWGVTAQVGTKIGHASYKEGGAETTWWPSSMEGSVGLVFKL